MQANVLVKTDELTHKEWLEYRRKGIGGSDIAAIMGVSPWGSPLTVYYEKVKGGNGDDKTIPQEVGLELEPYLRKKFILWGNEKYGEDSFKVLDHPKAILQHPQIPYLLANVDDLVFIHGKGDGGAEYKTVSEFGREGWGENELPDYYYTQVQHYMAVTGYEYWMVAALIGNRTFEVIEVPRNERIIEIICEKAEEFWNGFIVPQIEPAPTGLAAETTILGKLYRDVADKTVELFDMKEDYAQYKDFLEQKKQLETEIDIVKQRLMAAMKDAETARVDPEDQKARITWKTQNRAGYYVQPTSFRAFRVY